MARWRCRYGTSFCGSFGDLCEKCNEDVKAERLAKSQPAPVVIGGPGSLDLRSLTSEQLRGLRDSIDGLLHARARHPMSGDAVSVEVSIGGLRIKF